MRSITALAASAALLIALTGCSVSVTDASDETPSTASTPETTDDTTAETPTEEQESPVTATDATTWGTETAAARDAALAVATKTLSCDGELVIDDTDDAQVIEVEGTCEHLVLHLDGGIVIAGDVVTLDVYGDVNAVFADSLSVLNVSGDGNAVYWTGAAPDVSDSGAANVLTAG